MIVLCIYGIKKFFTQKENKRRKSDENCFSFFILLTFFSLHVRFLLYKMSFLENENENPYPHSLPPPKNHEK